MNKNIVEGMVGRGTVFDEVFEIGKHLSDWIKLMCL